MRPLAGHRDVEVDVRLAAGRDVVEEAVDRRCSLASRTTLVGGRSEERHAGGKLDRQMCLERARVAAVRDGRAQVDLAAGRDDDGARRDGDTKVGRRTAAAAAGGGEAAARRPSPRR